MQKISTFLIVITISISSSFAQDYKPLLDDFNEWHFTTCFSGCNTDIYYTNGDTIVGTENYKVLDGFHYISRTFLLREEVAAKKVFLNIVDAAGGNEYLLYDFSLNIGDSIDMKNPITPFLRDAGFYKVDSIVNRVMSNNEMARHFYLSPTLSNIQSTNPAIWIEGVGSLSLINAPSGFPDINNVGALSCAFKDGELYYSNLDSIDNCESVLGMNDYSSGLNKIILNSLITDGVCEIYNTEEISSIEVFDMNGRKILSSGFKNESTINLDLGNNKDGVYFVIITSKNFKMKTFRVVVSK